MNKKKIAIIGPYPGGYGGISIHIQRVLRALKNRNVKFDFYDESYDSKYAQNHFHFYANNRKEVFNNIIKNYFRLFFTPYSLIHHHAPDINVRIALSVFALFGKKIYIHIHGPSLEMDLKKKDFKFKLLKFLLKYPNIIVDNLRIKKFAQNYNKKEIPVIDAFLPPIYNKKYLREFQELYQIESKKYDLIISMIGWFTNILIEDDYGFLLLVEAINKLKKNYNIKVITSINGIKQEDIHLKFLKKMKEYNLEDNFLLIYKNLDEIWPIYLVSDVFIRPTNSDGNALSINEALITGTKVITSDCIDRPKGVILYKNLNVDSLIEKIIEIIQIKDSLPDLNKKIQIFKNNSFSNRLFRDIYKIDDD